MKYEFKPLTPETWRDFEELFGPRGACGGCWCMTWRAARADYEKQKGEGNRRAMKALVHSGSPTGLLAYHLGKPAGWISVAPREQFAYLARARTLQPPDDRPVWSVTCFFIHKDHRRQGLSSKLLEAAAKQVRKLGGRVLEGYPIVPRSPEVPAVFAWTGLPEVFERAGFGDCETAAKGRRLMRRELR